MAKRQKLHNYSKVANDKKLIAIFIMAEDEIEEKKLLQQQNEVLIKAIEAFAKKL